MKPGKNDIPIKVKISGLQLTELQKHSCHMIEAFGLDTRVGNYKGKSPQTINIEVKQGEIVTKELKF
jgi:ABC-type ATPase with predicted acetyltransferase domain